MGKKQGQNNYQLKYMEAYRQSPAPKPSQSKQPKSPEKKPHGCVRFLLFVIQLGLIGLLIGLFAFIGGYIYLSNELEEAIAEVSTYRGTGVGGTPRFFDRNGQLLFELKTTEKRRWLAYNEIPRVVIDAAVTVEDDTFWTNPGFDPAAIGAAIVSNIRNDGRPIGASTITQQLVRHIAFSYEDRVGTSYERKIREIFLAFILTQKRSKEGIVQMYLNEIYYGNLAYGVEAAAQTYFGKSAIDLNLAEAAFLAGLPQSPVDWDPYTNYEGAKIRQEFIIDLMYEDGYINYVDAEVAKGAPIRIQPRISIQEEVAGAVLQAPHFVLYVQDELERLYGPDALTLGGWQVTTSLDLNIHNLAEQAVRQQVAAKAANHDVSNGSVMALKPSTGEILAMVGSLNYFNDAIDGQVNVALQPRQPGSSIKPITYASALERGWSTADILWDVPIKLDLGGGQLMTPVNYDGYYHGPVLFRDSLANSYNIPPIQLIRDIGVGNMIATARKMGITSLEEGANFYGLALTLGGGEVPLIEMAHAYATLANMGQRPRLTSILRITDSRGNVIYDAQQERIPPANVLDPRIAYIITDILDDDQARIPAMGRDNPLNLPFPAAAKTGTTNDFRDAWTMGYTPGLVVGVWLGNADGHPMDDLPGLRGASPVWQTIVEGVYADTNMLNSLMVAGAPPPTDFPRPEGIEERDVCLPQGTGSAVCTASRPDLFMSNTALHGIGRVGYNIRAEENPGAWTLAYNAMNTEDAQRVSRQPLQDGTQPPIPTLCVVNTSRPPDGVASRLFLPIPPHYPDEVRARVWAQSHGWNNMAPPTACPPNSMPARTSNRSSSGTIGSGSAPTSNNQNSVPVSNSGLSQAITSPASGQRVSGLVPIIGSASFDPAQVQYYKLEIGSGFSPTSWTTFGTTHSQPVRNGTLEQLQANALAEGEYVIRLVLVGYDGNFVGDPYYVPIHIGN